MLLDGVGYGHSHAFLSVIASTHLKNPYPNTQLDLFYNDNLSFSMHDSQYVTNQSMHRSKYVTNHQLEKDVGCKVLQFINTMKITKFLGYKTYGVQTQQLLQKKDELGHMSLVTICL